MWRDALELAHSLYRESSRGSFGRDFALRDQVRRAAISVVSNIAEGFESRTDRLFSDYLGRAKASAGELRAQLHLACREGYLDDEAGCRLVSRAASISRQLAGLMKYLERGSADQGRERTESGRERRFP